MSIWALIIVFYSVHGGTEKVTIKGFSDRTACEQFYDESIVSVENRKRKLRYERTVLTAICLPTENLTVE